MSAFDRRLARGLFAWVAITVVASAIAYASAAPARGTPPDPAAARWAVAALERARRDEPIPGAPSSARERRASAPIVILAFDLGRPIARSTGERTLDAAVRRAIREFGANPALSRGTEFRDDRTPRARFSVTVPLGDGYAPVTVPGLRSFAYVPTRDALVARFRGREEALVPDEMVASGLVAGALRTGLPELDVGVRIDDALDVLGERFGVDRGTLVAEAEFTHRRVRTISADVYPDHVAPTLEAARAGMLEAAHYLARQLSSLGFFEYKVDARTGDTVPGEYLLARHAGAAYFLAQAARIEGDPELRTKSRIALGAMLRVHGRSCGAPENLCFDEGGFVDVGTAALALIAFSELELVDATDDGHASIERLGRFLLSLQRPDGEMMHRFDLAANGPIDVQLPYFSGEVALAFLRADEITGDPRYARAAERLLRHLGESSWDFPASRYIHAEEHWTCIAAGEARGRIDARAVTEFCRSVFDWNTWAQLAPGDSPFPVAGNYGFGPTFAPRYPALGTRIESFVELYRATIAEGRAIPGMRAHLERGIASALSLQFVPGPTRHIAFPHVVRGGIGGSYTDPIVRIDHVQHVGSALARWVELLRDERATNRRSVGTPRTPRR